MAFPSIIKINLSFFVTLFFFLSLLLFYLKEEIIFYNWTHILLIHSTRQINWIEQSRVWLGGLSHILHQIRISNLNRRISGIFLRFMLSWASTVFNYIYNSPREVRAGGKQMKPLCFDYMPMKCIFCGLIYLI